MSETTSAPAQQSVQINLRDMANRYMTALQRTFDLAASSVGALRCQTEKDYEDFSRQARFMPSPQQHADFNTIRTATELWLIRQLLSDSLGMLVPFLEDTRSVAALAHWKADGSLDSTKVQKILNEDRQAFLRLSLPDKAKLLREQFNLSAPNETFIAAYLKLTQALSRGDKLVEADITEGNELVIPLTAVQIEPSQPGQQNQTGRLVTVPKRVAVGQTIEFKKEEIMALFASFSIFVTALMSALQRKVQELLPNENAQS